MQVAGVTREVVAVDDRIRPLSEVDEAQTRPPGDPWRQMFQQYVGDPILPPAEPPAALGLTCGSAAAGAGFRHWAPDGALMLRLIEQWMRSFATENLGGEEIVTPTLYRWRPDDQLHDLAGSFEDRLFITALAKRAHMLRYSADPGFFDYAASLTIRADSLPVRMWEYGTFFRRNRAGELRGIERLHEFRLLDHHTVCRLELALDEYEQLLTAQIMGMRALVGDLAVEFTLTRDHLDPCLPIIRRAAAATGSPAIVEILSGPKHYWSMKSFLYVNGPYDTCNLQLDEANPVRFRLNRGTAEVAVVHATMCSAERMVLVMTTAAAQRPHPGLPFWLSPVQLRVLPVDPATAAGRQTLQLLRASGIRAEYDDRPRSVSWRIRDAALGWVPYLVVVGERDREAEDVELRYRDGRRVTMPPSRLVDLLLEEQAGYPQVSLPRSSTRERYWLR